MRSLLWRICAALALALTLAAVSASAAPPPAAAVTAAAAATPSAADRSSRDSLFVRHDSDALLTLAVSEPTAWREYQALVLSRARATPLLLFFDDDGDCSTNDVAATDDDEVVEEEEAVVDGIDDDASLLEPRECSAERSALLAAALGGVARAFAHAGLRVVRVPAPQLPQVLRYHRVTTRPSLLWLAPRSAKNFQRFPHPETNALDLTSPAKLLEVLQSQQQQQQQQQEQQRRKRSAAPAPSAASTTRSSSASSSAEPEQQLTAVLNEVVRLWFVKSGLAPASSARTGVVPPAAASGLAPRRASGDSAAAAASNDDDGLSVTEFLPVLGLLAFVGAVAHDKRELLLRTLRGRFVWFFWSVGVMYAAYSGVFHSLIHGMPLFYFGAHHGLLVFHPSGRRQFVLEGLLSGAWSFLASLGAFSVAEVLPMERSRAARSEVFGYSLVIIAVSSVLLHVTFMAKTPWLGA